MTVTDLAARSKKSVGGVLSGKIAHLTKVGGLVCKDLGGILGYTVCTAQLPMLKYWKEVCSLGYVLDLS